MAKDQDLELLHDLLKAADDGDDDPDKDADDEEKELKKSKLKKGDDDNPDVKEPDAKSVIEDKNLKKSEDEYDAAYMKKHMKQCMTENPEAAKAYAKELGYLKKATDDIAGEMEGIDEADSILIDGTDFIKAQGEFNAGVMNLLGSLSASMEKISAAVSVNNEFAMATARVIAKAQEVPADVTDPAPRKSVESSMQKATEQKELPGLVKAKDMDFRDIRRMVLKAVTDGNQDAIKIATHIDACGGMLSRLQPDILKAIESIAASALV